MIISFKFAARYLKKKILKDNFDFCKKEQGRKFFN